MQKLSLLFLLFAAINAPAQVEHFASVDPVTGTRTVKSTLPGVYWINVTDCTTFDTINRRYYFVGLDSLQIISRLYGVDVTTGNMVSNPLFPQNLSTGDNILGLHYDHASGKIYGLHWDNSAQLEYFISIDPATGLHTLIDTLPGVNGIGVSLNTLDEANGRFVFGGLDLSSTWHLYSIDVTNGSIVSSPVISGADYCLLSIDRSTGIFYGLHWDNSTSTEYAVSINPVTGVYTTLWPIPNVVGIANFSCHAFDELHHRMIFRGLDNANDWKLYSVDVTNGSIYANPLFYVLPNPQSNIIELVHESHSDTIWALNWDADKMLSVPTANMRQPDIAPNPFTDQTQIDLGKSAHAITITLYDMQGKRVRTASASDTQQLRISREGLPSGVYALQIISDGMVYRTKLVITD